MSLVPFGSAKATGNNPDSRRVKRHPRSKGKTQKDGQSWSSGHNSMDGVPPDDRNQSLERKPKVRDARV